MTIERETLVAWIDGELNEIDARRVAKAVAADPALAAEADAHRALQAKLTAHFAPLLEAPVPERLTALLTAQDNVVPLRARRPAKAWLTGLALAASLVVGVGLGTRIDRGAVVSDGGTLIARGELAEALDTQLASAQDGAAVRVLVSFTDRDGAYCRGFEDSALSGIACRSGTRWQVRRTVAVVVDRAEYRQAGSAEIMAAAQGMAAGAPLDADAERRARDAGWR